MTVPLDRAAPTPHLRWMLTIRDIETALALPPGLGRSDHDLDAEIAGRAAAVVPGRALRPAAVLCPIVERAQGLQVVLTRRAEHLPHHPGQISFPGGKVQPGDPSPLATALREADEEIGLGRDKLEVLGRLDPYVTSTSFRVLPFVGRVAPSWRPFVDDSEVAEVFEVPLDFLMDPANHERRHRDWQGQRRHFYAMPWGPHFIWGATAGMLKGLSDRLAAVQRLGAA